MEAEGCGEGVEFFVVLDVFLDAVVVAACTSIPLASHTAQVIRIRKRAYQR